MKAKKRFDTDNVVLGICVLTIVLVGVFVFRILVMRTNVYSFDDFSDKYTAEDVYLVRDANYYVVMRENYQYLLEGKYKKLRQSTVEEDAPIEVFRFLDQDDHVICELRQYKDGHFGVADIHGETFYTMLPENQHYSNYLGNSLNLK